MTTKTNEGRYRVDKQVEHGCCNEARVFDSEDKQNETVCECLDEDDARLIANTLNSYAEITEHGTRGINGKFYHIRTGAPLVVVPPRLVT